MNFHGADKNLKNVMKTLDHDKVQQTLRHRGIDWIYNAPLASAQGRAWEQLI